MILSYIEKLTIENLHTGEGQAGRPNVREFPGKLWEYIVHSTVITKIKLLTGTQKPSSGRPFTACTGRILNVDSGGHIAHKF